jgi:hypothetical protein
LADWRRSTLSWKEIRKPDGYVDMKQFLRRLTRLEAGILDVLPRAEPSLVLQILEKYGLPYESLSEAVAEAVGIQRPSRW